MYNISAILMKFMVKHKIIHDSSNIWERQLIKMIENVTEIWGKGSNYIVQNIIGREQHKITQEMAAKLHSIRL